MIRKQTDHADAHVLQASLTLCPQPAWLSCLLFWLLYAGVSARVVFAFAASVWAYK